MKARFTYTGIRVNDLDDSIAFYTTVLDMKTPTSRWAFIRDPNGIYIELFA